VATFHDNLSNGEGGGRPGGGGEGGRQSEIQID
jgi:hypothetical protein